MPKESEMLSAIAITTNAVVIPITGFAVRLKLTITARPVITAEVAPKLKYLPLIR
jgi:hypothetical protein